MAEIGSHLYRRAWWGLVLRGMLGIAVAVLIFWRPLASVASLALVIALWALFSGSVDIVRAFEIRPYFSHWWVSLIGGIVSVLFGLAALYYYPELSLVYAVVWVAWWFMTIGLFGIAGSIYERKLGLPWGWTLAFGIVGIVAGVFALLAPPATLAAIMGFIAGVALVIALTLFFGAFKLTQLKEGITDALGAKA